MKPRWSFSTDKNPARDEHYRMPGVFGIFSVYGWCLVGICVRLHDKTYHSEVGVILFNHFIGWWWDEHPEEWTRETR